MFGVSLIRLRKCIKVSVINNFLIQFCAEFGILCPFKCKEIFQVRYELRPSSEIEEGAGNQKIQNSICCRIRNALPI